MKSAEIHTHLDKAAIRDFLSKASEEGYQISNCSSVSRLKKQIAELQRELAGALQYEAALELMHINGWSIYDLSDDVEDYCQGVYFPFVGTEEEYHALMKRIKG